MIHGPNRLVGLHGPVLILQPQFQIGNKPPVLPNTLPRRAAGHGLQRLGIIGIASCDLEGHDLALVVDGQVALEAKEPAHGGAAPLDQPLEHPVSPDPYIVTDHQLGAIDRAAEMLGAFPGKAGQNHQGSRTAPRWNCS